MRGLLACIFMVVWQWSSLCLVTNVLITDKGQPLLRLITWGVLWLIPTVFVFIWWCKGDTKYKRVFTLETVYLMHGSGFGRMIECFSIDERFATYDVFRNTKEFFIDLEDLDDGVAGEDGVLYDCRPKYHTSLKDVEIHSRSDFLHVMIDRTGAVTVKYIGRDASVVCTEVVWHISKEIKNGK